MDFWAKREENNTKVTPSLKPIEAVLEDWKSNDKGAHKVMCMGDKEELDIVMESLTLAFPDELHLYRSKDTYLEITPKYMDKAKALKTLLLEYYNFGMEDVMSFGDNHNDDELIKSSGIGVAVGNATTTLKSFADYVSPYNNKEHAVARTIDHFLGS